jgi:excisionase family DNA binding protein
MDSRPVTAVPADTGRLLDVAGIAAYLGLSERQIRGLVESAEIPVTRFGRRLWFDVVTIDRWVARCTSRPGQAA